MLFPHLWTGGNNSSSFIQLDFPGGAVVEHLPVNAGDARDTGSIPGSGRSPGGEHGNPLQYSCLEHPMDTGVWQATVRGVAKTEATKDARTRMHMMMRPTMFSGTCILFFCFCLAYIYILRVLERSKNLVKGELTDFPQILLDSYAVDSLQMIKGIFMEGLMRNP